MRIRRRLRRSERGAMYGGERGVRKKEKYAGILASKGKGTGQAETI